MSKKRKLSLITAVIMVTSTTMTAPAYAREAALPIPETYVESGTPTFVTYWDDTSTIEPSVSKSGKTIFAQIYIRAKTTGAKISGKLYLEHYTNGKWSTAQSWAVSDATVLKTSKTYTGTPGARYRVRFSGTVGSDKIDKTSTRTVTV